MSIDKSWIKLTDQLSDEYEAGVMDFLQRARQCIDSRGLVKCQCRRCVNVEFQTIDVLENESLVI